MADTKTKKEKKTFDCIAFKRKAQRKIYKEIKDLTPEEEIEYFKKKAEKIRSKIFRDESGRERG